MADEVRGTRDGSPSADQSGVADMLARLQRLEQELAQIQRLAQFGSWEWDITADQVTWSDELYQICGASPGEVPATYEAFLRAVHADDRDMVDEVVRRAIADGASYVFDHRLVRPDGDVRWLHARGTVVADEHGGSQRVYGVAMDITERKRSEQYLREFILNASHELRTPAAAISQAAHVLSDRTLPAADRGAAMGALTRQSKRLFDLSTNLFDLVALDPGAPSVMLGLSIMLGPVPLAQSVLKAAASAPADGVTLTAEIGADIAVLAETTELERVFANLLANARIHGGPNVTVTASRMGDEVIVDVRDDGQGVPEDFLQGLFVPFAKRRKVGQGSGLGLAIVHQVMAAFGGAVSYHPAKPHGAVFTLRFAVAS